MFAEIKDGAIIGWVTSIPEPVEGEDARDFRPLDIQWPVFDVKTHQVGDPTDTVEADKVTRTWVVSSRPMSEMVPKSITPYQARKVLTAHGLRATVEAAIQQADQDVKDAWEYAQVIERDSPFITAIGLSLGLTSEQLDFLFIEASRIT